MGDTNKLLRKFYVDLRKSINALEISRAVSGLTTIDLEQIASREKNEGNSLAVDKLLDIVGRKSARTFVSFVQALKDYDSDDWADKITEEAKRNFPNIHKDLLPTATIKPVQTKSGVHGNAPDSSQTEEIREAYVRRDQLTTRTTTSVVERSVIRRQNYTIDGSDSEEESENLTLDTPLNMIDYEDAIKWIDELNREGQWKRLATKLKLKYHQVKDLEKHTNPAEFLFHNHCCEHGDMTVKHFMKYLKRANLKTVTDMVQDRLGSNEQIDGSNSLDAPPQTPQNDVRLPLNVPLLQKPSNVVGKECTGEKIQQKDLSEFESLTDNNAFIEDETELAASQKTTNIGSVANTSTEITVQAATVKIYNTHHYGKSTERNSQNDAEGNNTDNEMEKRGLSGNTTNYAEADRSIMRPNAEVVNDLDNNRSEDPNQSIPEEKPVITEPENIYGFEKPPEKECADLLGAAGIHTKNQRFQGVQKSTENQC